MREGPKLGNEILESKQGKLLQSWKQGPVILASGSSFKLENVRALGMPQTTGISVPEEVEEALFENVEGRSMHMHEMVAAMVAREKVAYVIEHGAPEDALICAFDTVVMETTRTLDSKRRRYLQKPENREEATRALTEYFTNLVEAKIWKDESTKGLVDEAARMQRPESIESLLSVGYPQALVHITTGMAVRVPHAGSDIDMIPSTVRLTPTALYDLAPLAEDERRQRIEGLVEQALTIMDEGERWRSVTTGLDYSDPRIKDLLGLIEAKIFSDMDESEAGIMKGMPQQAFDSYLKSLAKEKLRVKTDT